jgi:protein-disulfide isomerase
LRLRAIIIFVCSVAAIAQEASPPSTRPDIEKIVREYILQHPEVLLDSIRMYQERERAAQQQEQKDAVKQHQAELNGDPASPSAGEAGSTATIVEFFDYRCGFCKQAAPTITKLLSGTPNLRVVFKDFPILGPDSVTAAKAALAAQRQGAYFKFYQSMMANAEPVTTGVIERLASKLGLDVPRLKADMELPEIQAILDKNMKLAETIGVSSTPTFVIGSELVTGGMTEEAFRALLRKASPKPAIR